MNLFARSFSVFGLIGLIAAAAVIPEHARAQVDALNRLFNPYPETGRWGPRDGSRTGVFLEIQNGIVAGIWAGYDADGDAVWMSFSGALQPLLFENNPDDQRGWTLQSRLQRFSGGGCILIDADCSGEPVGDPGLETRDFIRLRFRGASRATLEVLAEDPSSGEASTDNPIFGPIEITPLIFGVEAPLIRPEAPQPRAPDLEGVWLVASVESLRNDQTPIDELQTNSGIIRIGPPEFSGSDSDPSLITSVNYRIVEDNSGLFPPDAEIPCNFLGSSEPTCYMDLGPAFVRFAEFKDISDHRIRIIAGDDSGSFTFYEAIRLNYD